MHIAVNRTYRTITGTELRTPAGCGDCMTDRHAAGVLTRLTERRIRGPDEVMIDPTHRLVREPPTLVLLESRLSARARGRRFGRPPAPDPRLRASPTGSAIPPAMHDASPDDGELGVLAEQPGGIVGVRVEVARPHGEVRDHARRGCGPAVPRRARPARRARCTPRASDRGPRARPRSIRAIRRAPARVAPSRARRAGPSRRPASRSRTRRSPRFEQAAEPPRRSQRVLAHVLHPGTGDEVGRAVPRLHRGGHPERREARQVVGMQASTCTMPCRRSTVPFTAPPARSRRARAGCPRRPWRGCASGIPCGRAR